MVNTKGGRRLGEFLDNLVGERKSPVIETAIHHLGMKMVAEKEEKGAWLGLNLTTKNGKVKISTHHSNSPCRELTHTGDEIIAIDGLRINSVAELNAAIHGKHGMSVEITLARQGILQTVSVSPTNNPNYLTKLEGKGNKLWQIITKTRQ